MYQGLTQPPFESVFQLTGYGQTRGHTPKLTKHCRPTDRDVRLWFFSERVINNRNLLDQTTEPVKGHAEKKLFRAHEIASRAHEIKNFCMSLRGLRIRRC